MAQRQGIVVALAVMLFVGGCDGGSLARPAQSARPSGPKTYRINQQWAESPGWRVRLTGMRCGTASDLDPGDPGDPDRQDVCLVGVAFTNDGDQARSFSGTADQPGPTWRVVGYDAQAHEFHGHARPVGTTAPGGNGTADLVFDVPAGLRLQRVLLGNAMVGLAR